MEYTLKLYPFQMKILYDMNISFASSGLMSELMFPKPYSTHIVDKETYYRISNIFEKDYEI